MPKVIKKRILCGAPSYMAQFTMIMLILVCMCMILSILSKNQESGFMDGEGMGKVRNANALGIVIGSGVFRFGASGKARTFAANPGDMTTESPQNPHIDLLKGEGGSGNTDLNAKVLEKAKFIFAKLNGSFPPKSSNLTQKINEELLTLGTGMSMFDFTLSIKCFCSEYQNEEDNRRLAFDRGLRIIRELNKRFNVPLSKMSCVVYDDESLMMKDAPKIAGAEEPGKAPLAPPASVPTQETALVIRVK